MPINKVPPVLPAPPDIVMYGCGSYTPARDIAAMSRQDKTGLWKPGTRRRKKPCHICRDGANLCSAAVSYCESCGRANRVVGTSKITDPPPGAKTGATPEPAATPAPAPAT